MIEVIITGIVAIGLSGGFLTWIRLAVKGYKNWKKDRELIREYEEPVYPGMADDLRMETRLTSRGRTHVL